MENNTSDIEKQRDFYKKTLIQLMRSTLDTWTYVWVQKKLEEGEWLEKKGRDQKGGEGE